MNKLVILSGSRNFKHSANKKGRFGAPELYKNIKLDNFKSLIKQLESIQSKWKKDSVIDGALVGAYFERVIPKSSRISHLFRDKEKHQSNNSIRGVSFEETEKGVRHVFTYYMPLDVLRNDINNLHKIYNHIKRYCKDKITPKDLSNIVDGKIPPPIGLSKSTCAGLLADISKIDKFDLKAATTSKEEKSVVTLYKTSVNLHDILKRVGLNHLEVDQIDDSTLCMTREQLDIMIAKAPYLVAMHKSDEYQGADDTYSDTDTLMNAATIDPPNSEPIVGVIDTPFDETAYFHEWVKSETTVSTDILTPKDFIHGTAVSSIIVDGPRINPELEDNCGRFRVKHFGVAPAGRFSSSRILKEIRRIVANNREIKVWNLSLGSFMEIHPNFISPEAAALDSLQTEYDVIFIVAGTNRTDSNRNVKLIGPPADSLNAIVVNSLNSQDLPASYSRKGPVLRYFRKPDVSCFGGDDDKPMMVCSPFERPVRGTSFAAPWITRKVAYLVYRMHYNKEVAKALIIHAATGWKHSYENDVYLIGYGKVPVDINEIIGTREDEIRFVITHTTDAYQTYTYDIPVPYYNNTFPFYARATLCYFPICSRLQGVDYTNTEMDIKFGRVKGIKIEPIDNNLQGVGDYTQELPAREQYAKWQNIKQVSDEIPQSKNRRAKRQYGDALWGLSVTTKERLKTERTNETTFAVVVTLREMRGRNRYDDFIKLCQSRGWLVTEADINVNNDIYLKGEEYLHLD